MNIVIGKTGESKAGTCIVYRTPKNEEYQEYMSDEMQDEQEEQHEEEEAYDPELDSPSSWTTKSSNAGKRKWKHARSWF